MTGIERIAAERQRQVDAEGWTLEHDDMHRSHGLAYAAACYAVPERIFSGRIDERGAQVEDAWPWERENDKRDPDVRCWYPEPLAIALSNRPELRQSRIKELVKAGALIAAEIDRLERMPIPAPEIRARLTEETT